METINRPVLDIGVAAFTLAGQDECGDRHVLAPFAGGVLVAVIDGIGHGAEAAHAAEIAIGVLRKHPHEPPASLIIRCHEVLRGTRGVVMSLASFNHLQKTMTWAGVGNVQGKLLSTDMLSQSSTLLSSAGTLGYKLVPVYPVVYPIKSGDTLIFATDGIREDFYQQLNLKHSLQELADDILARYLRLTDDALVLVGRYF